jgi:hypothetical protein
LAGTCIGDGPASAESLRDADARGQRADS